VSQIADVAAQVISGAIPDPSGDQDTTGYCLSFNTHIVSKALGFPIYSKYPVPYDPRYRSPTAATAEAAWSGAGLAVNPPVQAGDLVFQPWVDPKGGAPGHTGIVVQGKDGQWYVAENSYDKSGIRSAAGTAVQLRPIDRWAIRTIIRFPDDQRTGTPATLDVAAVSTASPSSVSPGTPTPPIPVAGLIQTILGDLNILVNPPAGPDYSKEQPLWLYNTLKIYEGIQPTAKETNLAFTSGTNSIVIIRKPYADEMATAMPILGPLSIAIQAWEERYKQVWTKLKGYYLESESWGRTYLPLFNLGNPETVKDSYRYPLPFVSQVSVRQDAGTGAVGEIELQIGDLTEAEMIHSSLCMMQRYKNAIIEIWRPVMIYDDEMKSERQVIVPAMTGMLDEVSSSPYPHTIKLRVLPQDQFMNMRGINPDEVKPGSTTWPAHTQLHTILETIATQYKIKFFTPSAFSLGDVPQLQREVGDSGFETMGMNPLDVARQVAERAGGLQLIPLFGTEVFGRSINVGFIPRAVYMIYDPNSFGPFTPGFWQNELWSHFLSPVAKILGRNQSAAGEVAVFYPEDLAHNQKYISNMADILRTYASDTPRANAFGQFVDKVLAIAATLGVGSGPAVRAAIDGKTQDALVELIKNWWPSGTGEPVQKYFAPILNVEEFVARTPASSDLANPIFGTAGGAGGQRTTRVSAERAAKLMQVTQGPDGSFTLNTPAGAKAFDAHDSVTLYYASSFGRPTMVSPVSPSTVDDNSGKFYPFTVSMQIKPSYGVRVGMVAAVIGMGRLDGIWEIQSVQWSLGRNEEQTVILRTQRDLFIV
jgi:hypothetical protein